MSFEEIKKNILSFVYENNFILFSDDVFYNWLMNKKSIFEDEDLFDLTLDCLRYYPKDRLKKESLIEHKFFHPKEIHEPYPLIRLQPNLNPLHEAVSDSSSQTRKSNMFNI